MNGWNFPEIFKTNGNGVDIIEGKEDVIKDLRLLMNSELFEMRYDPGYGSNVPLLRYRPDTQLNRDLIIDAVFDAQIFCPNVRFTRSSITIERADEVSYRITVPVTIDNSDYKTDVVLYVQAMND